jgi:hypothetical protein
MDYIIGMHKLVAHSIFHSLLGAYEVVAKRNLIA